jgi:signal transduction histidine kinase
VLLFLATGAALLFVWIGRVTREQAAAEAALIEARDRAEAANIAKSRFLANMSHELRTPLNGVVGMAEIMAVGELSPIQRSHLDVLRSAAGNLTQMIEHLLQITRLERHEVVIERAPFDPAAAVTRAVEQHAEAARIRGLDLRCDVQPLGRRLGDERHLDQILGYLIDNALTYTERGGVTVTARQDGEVVRIAVTDTGMGIRADLKPQLFDVFVQGDDSLTKRFDGVGLGLSICRNLVEAMGGRISVESEEGAGSTFTVDLPLPVVEERTERAAA